MAKSMNSTTAGLAEMTGMHGMTWGGVGRRPGGQMIARATLAASLAIGVFPASGTPVDKCVKERMATGEIRSVALATCLRDAGGSTTVPPGGSSKVTSGGGDEGSSTGVVVLVGLGGVLAGAALATALRRRVATTATSGSAMPGPAAPPFPPSMSPPSAAARPDRSPGLVTALIDLADRVPSQALRAEILAALGRAGVYALEPATGEVFDVARMRGVSNAPAPDAGWVGRVASTERAGYHDGTTMLRLPEVVVYTAGS